MKQGNEHRRRLATLFYDLGSISGAVGMVLGILGLVWTCWVLGQSVWGPHPGRHGSDSNPNSSSVHHLTKRHTASLDLSPSTATGATSSHLQLILLVRLTPLFMIVQIPGLTTPLSHLPLLIFSLLTSQIIHEAGHFFSAAIDSLPLTSLGVSLTVLIPSAFVALPSASLLSLPSRARARIAAAGAWHNLVFWGMLVLAGWMWNPLWIWEDVSDLGKIVIGVDEDSPLHPHLPLGSLIIGLDDIPLNIHTDGHGTEMDVWTQYLTDSQFNAAWPGSDLGCTKHHSAPLQQPSDGSDSKSPGPGEKAHWTCTFVNDDEVQDEDGVCVRPRDGGELLRIVILDEDRERVVLWRGPRGEVWEQVETSSLKPPSLLWFLPVYTPGTVSTFFAYLKSLTLTLYLLNLLPLPMLDGSQLLDAFLDMYFSPSPLSSRTSFARRNDLWQEEMEAGEGHGMRAYQNGRDDDEVDGGRSAGGRRRKTVQKDNVVKVVTAGTIGLVGGCVGLGILKAAGVWIYGS
ncbi:uncharacterized protein STEHIDRAFT_113130 [Stereum hirsutum FP-91666 SS1]|uniref:uncharacterized protein n=1 Tax=Stereum hirsutum (strain FP-91666) TaxID=721885 RepID=UPI00044493CC|nr:uncharacterized protein STEHIDRAFT_113130 [Stereum hirsutum FP-91666 SS1]EIM83886.1 hypothetical protein STEHIDRAFT_113130 [Stereum hirsutum FP-91666 SS1]